MPGDEFLTWESLLPQRFPYAPHWLREQLEDCKTPDDLLVLGDLLESQGKPEDAQWVRGEHAVIRAFGCINLNNMKKGVGHVRA